MTRQERRQLEREAAKSAERTLNDTWDDVLDQVESWWAEQDPLCDCGNLLVLIEAATEHEFRWASCCLACGRIGEVFAVGPQ